MTRKTRYFKIVQTAAAGSWWSIHELNAYESHGLVTLAGDTNGGQLTELINGSAFGWASPTTRSADQIAGDKARNLIGNEGVFSVINTDALPH